MLDMLRLTPSDIKNLLQTAGFTQADIARKTGVSPVTVHLVISGRVTSARVREAIALAINKPVSEIWPDAKPEEQAA